ncbi:uncharacterized protein LOC134184494 isoform X2 [Corticium candelabrum]|uniref:uncharacterized protein LOC134184494 isoform X2 n=1 Tax=Corticium candelabrum TaxID=121492 RepID=UPI002E3522C0|nr:uncharacterized protein LOC134184494 isoform X2 [Corticium candelabrum]
MAYRSGRRGRACRPRGKQNMKGLCRYYMQGSCKKGPDCDFVHDPSRKQNIEYDNPNEAREGEEELPFSSRSDFTFVVGHGGSFLDQLREDYPSLLVRPSWPLGKMFLKGSDEEKRKFKEAVSKRLASKVVGYLPIPQEISVHNVIGRQGRTLAGLGKNTNTLCKVMSESQQDITWNLEIMACSLKDLESAKEILSAKLFTQVVLDDSILCINTMKRCENVMITFNRYERYRPVNLHDRHVHEMCLQESLDKQATDDVESIVAKGLKNIRIEDRECTEAATLNASRSSLKLTPYGYIHEENVRYVCEWTKSKLKMLETQTAVPKLEARFGKVLWTDMPPDIATGTYSILEFEQESTLNLKTSFATFTDSDLTCLSVGDPFVVESYDLKVIPGRQLVAEYVAKRKIDLRVTVDDGHFKLAAAFGDEAQKSCADWICLDGKYDFRLSVSAREILQHRDEFQRLIDTLKKEEGDGLSYQNTPELTVHYIRHKKKRCYPVDDCYCIAIYEIQEYDVKRCLGVAKNVRLVADFQTIEPHSEVEFQNVKWMARFYARAGYDIKSAFSTEQIYFPEDVTGFDEPWTTDGIMSELPEFLEQVDNVCEILNTS